jgi:hypothetical protein
MEISQVRQKQSDVFEKKGLGEGFYSAETQAESYYLYGVRFDLPREV